MTHQRFRSLPALAFALAIAFLAVGIASAAQAGHQVFQGIVRHVSSDNIKVYDNHSMKTQSFMIVARFGNVFKADGTTPAQMKDIAAGDYVKVYYDQKFLGAFHADRILILNNANHVEGMNHS
jgi:hypothetical protein